MPFYKILYFLLCGLFLLSCQNEEEKSLREKLSSLHASNIQQEMTLTPAVINEYRHMEKVINKQYINDIKSIISNDFEEKLDKFEECEFGFFKSYKHMFKVLIEDEDTWNDYWNIKKSKYFSTLNTHEKLRDCYKNFNRDIQNLRKQISHNSLQTSVLEEFELNLGNPDISLSKMEQHSYTNLLIEFGTDIAIGLLVMGIVAIFSFIAGCVTPPSWIVTILTIIISVILSLWNDNRMINSIREQYQVQISIDNIDLLNKLDNSTNIFYDYISK